MRSRVHEVIRRKCHEHDRALIAVGGIEDHVHVLVRMVPRVAVSILVGELKGVSSRIANLENTPDDVLRWQTGYGAFSLRDE